MTDPQEHSPIDGNRSAAASLSARRRRLGRGSVVVHLSGEIDISTEAHMREALWQCAADPEVRWLVCDLSDVDFMGCAGLTVLLDAFATMETRDATLRVVATRPIIRLVFDATELTERLGVRWTLADALAVPVQEAGA